MNASYNWEKKTYYGVVWTYRTALFEVQSVVIGTMARHCPEIAHQFLAVQSNSSFDNNVNCYNPLSGERPELYVLFRNASVGFCILKIDSSEYERVQGLLMTSRDQLNYRHSEDLTTASTIPRYRSKPQIKG